MRSKNLETSHDAVSKAPPPSSLLSASIFYSIVLHVQQTKWCGNYISKSLLNLGHSACIWQNC